MLAKMTAIGNLGRDAETRSSASGDIASFSIATSHGFGDRKRTTWWRVTVFGKAATWAGKLRKGDKVAIVGDAYMDKWTDKNGVEKETPSIDTREVVGLMPKPAEGGGYGGADDTGVPF